jgi:hypothetical protein
MFEGFDALSDAPDEVRRHQAEHGQEAKERWGGTATYRESMRRARGYTKPDWRKIQEEGEASESRMAELLAAGADPEGGEALAGAEAMREHITRWLYPCSYQIHAGLAEHVRGGTRASPPTTSGEERAWPASWPSRSGPMPCGPGTRARSRHSPGRPNGLRRMPPAGGGSLHNGG